MAEAAAEGPITEMVEAFRAVVAASPKFQAFVGVGDAVAVATAQLGLAMTSGDGRVEGEMRKVLVAEMMADPVACAKGREIGGAVLDVLRRVAGAS